MRLKARQTRFLIGTTTCWIAMRAIMLWGGEGAIALPSPPPAHSHSRAPAGGGPVIPIAGTIVPPAPLAARSITQGKLPPAWRPVVAVRALPLGARSDALVPAIPVGKAGSARSVTPSVGIPSQLAASYGGKSGRSTSRSRWAVSAYAFVRPGSGRPSLAAGGELGGSQVAARLTYRLNRDGPERIALAARVYAPIGAKGAEAAAGFDWHPLPQLPLRFSIERRVALDRAGRDAWSAYAAGGFYREPMPGKVVVDGYAQAGVVGLERRDLFVDGALRAGRRLPLGRGTLVAGAGLWGAAQPGVSRLDAGPRLAAILPVEQRTLSLAIEGRLRVAGRASPGSGAAFTLGVDF